MTRSVPEKTLEHWCSIHLGYRYRAKLLMSWPSVGADVDISPSPGVFGKRFWLELKTTEWKDKLSRHELNIDLNQLAAYGRQSVPDYYVFPRPPWNGVLSASTAWLGTTAHQQLAYQSHSAHKWFAEWMWVIPGACLRTSLAAELAALRPGSKKTNSVIAWFSTTGEWWARGLDKQPQLHWRKFWQRMSECGDATWAAQFLLPTRPVGPGPTTPSGPSGPSATLPPGVSPNVPRVPIPTSPVPPGASSRPPSPIGSSSPSRVTTRDQIKVVFSEEIDDRGEVFAYSPLEADAYVSVDAGQSDAMDSFDWNDAHRMLATMTADALHIT